MRRLSQPTVRTPLRGAQPAKNCLRRRCAATGGSSGATSSPPSATSSLLAREQHNSTASTRNCATTVEKTRHDLSRRQCGRPTPCSAVPCSRGCAGDGSRQTQQSSRPHLAYEATRSRHWHRLTSYDSSNEPRSMTLSSDASFCSPRPPARAGENSAHCDGPTPTPPARSPSSDRSSKPLTEPSSRRTRRRTRHGE